MKNCVICEVEIGIQADWPNNWGHNAWPVAEGQCCDQCQRDQVLPARIEQFYLNELIRKQS